MVIAKIYGGLGNQLFQYSCGRALSLRLGTELKLDTSWFNDCGERSFELPVFKSVEIKIASEHEISEYCEYNKKRLFEKAFYKIFNRFLWFQYPYIRERFYHFDPKILSMDDSVYLDGYWQSEKYFKEYSDILKKELELDVVGNVEEIKQIDEICKLSDSVAIHVRRGDYEHISRHALCPVTYYNDGISYFKKIFENPQFIIFSDDEKWVRNTFEDLENSLVFHSVNSIVDFFAMSSCKNQIIANSTFSWWAAWLNKNSNKKIVSPKKWFNSNKFSIKDLIPSEWVMI